MGYGTLQQPSKHSKALPGFGSGECIGLLLLPTTEGLGDVELFKNGKHRGRLASGVSTQALWPFATLPPQEVRCSGSDCSTCAHACSALLVGLQHAPCRERRGLEGSLSLCVLLPGRDRPASVSDDSNIARGRQGGAP